MRARIGYKLFYIKRYVSGVYKTLDNLGSNRINASWWFGAISRNTGVDCTLGVDFVSQCIFDNQVRDYADGTDIEILKPKKKKRKKLFICINRPGD